MRQPSLYLETTIGALVGSPADLPSGSKRQREDIANDIVRSTPTVNTSKRFRPSFDTTDVTEALKTPHGGYCVVALTVCCCAVFTVLLVDAASLYVLL